MASNQTAQQRAIHSRYGQGRGGRPWRRLRESIMKRDGYMCQCSDCKGAKRIAHEVDHIIPISQGGTDEPSNLQAMHRECHAEKTKREANPSYRRRPTIGLDGYPTDGRGGEPKVEREGLGHQPPSSLFINVKKFHITGNK